MATTKSEIAKELDISEEYIIMVKEKPFIRYAGLLDKAHNKGFKDLAFFGFEDGAIINLDIANKSCIYSITAVFTDGTKKATFIGTGHACPSIVSPNEYVDYYVTISETRAKARALRDALNIPITSIEELSDGVKETLSYTEEPHTSNNGTNNTSKEKDTNGSKLSPKQKSLINGLLSRNNRDLSFIAPIMKKFNVDSIDNLTIPAADYTIKALQKAFNAK